MATTEHASNEQMAEIMGWTQSGIAYFDNNSGVMRFLVATWNPTANLNHTALVESRLAELGLHNQYLDNLGARFRFDAWGMFTASAQTRCDAAWATWQAWRQREKEQAK